MIAPEPSSIQPSERLRRSVDRRSVEAATTTAGDALVRSVKGFRDGACLYVEQLPGDGRMECLYPEDKLSQIADFYRNPARFEGAEIRSRTEFVDGEAVTKTTYIVDGKAIYHPLNDSIEKGECQVLGYN